MGGIGHMGFVWESREKFSFSQLLSHLPHLRMLPQDLPKISQSRFSVSVHQAPDSSPKKYIRAFFFFPTGSRLVPEEIHHREQQGKITSPNPLTAPFFAAQTPNPRPVFYRTKETEDIIPNPYSTAQKKTEDIIS